MSEKTQMAEVARLYYGIHEKRLNQETISKRLGITQSQVSKLLKDAEEQGLIEHTIRSTTEELKERLMKEFPHLLDVKIVEIGGFPKQKAEYFLRELGMAGAHYLTDRIKHRTSIGVSGGITLLSTIEAMGRLKMEEGARVPEDCKVYPLIVTMLPKVIAINPAGVALTLIRWLESSSGTVFELPPAEIKRGGKKVLSIQAFKENAAIKNWLSEIAELDYYLIGIGSIDYEQQMKGGSRGFIPSIEFNSLVHDHGLLDSLKNSEAKGSALYQPFNQSGDSLINEDKFEPLRDHMLFLPLETLRKHVKDGSAEVIAIAGGHRKHEALRAALHGKIFNVLITDSWTIENTLKKE